MKHYERVAGIVTRDEAIRKLDEELIHCEQYCRTAARILGLHQGDSNIATGWRAMAEIFYQIRLQLERNDKPTRTYGGFGPQRTIGEIFTLLNETLIECEELCAVIGHLHMTEDDKADATLASGWRGISQLLYRARIQIIKFSQGKLS